MFNVPTAHWLQMQRDGAMTSTITAARSKLAHRRILIAVLAVAQIRKAPIALADADSIAAVILNLLPKTLVRRLAQSDDRVALTMC